jgi:hypothetical protein
MIGTGPAESAHSWRNTSDAGSDTDQPVMPHQVAYESIRQSRT